MNDWFQSSKPLILGHRGASADAPENTLEAFHMALDHGADGIELDVRLSSDGQPFVLHDASIDRTTDGHGRLADLSSEQINDLLIEGRHPVPSLDQVFKELDSQPLYNLELKATMRQAKKSASIVGSHIRHHNLENKILISSFNPFVLTQVRKFLGPTVPLGLARSMPLTKFLHARFPAEADHPDSSLVTKHYMLWARRRGLHVVVWTVDSIVESRRLIELGVDANITNQPRKIAPAVVPGKNSNNS